MQSASSPPIRPRDFEEFSRGRQLGGATVVLDSSGGSVNDAITLGRRFRNLGLLTTVGISLQNRSGQSARPAVAPEAYCESMCVFLLLAGKKRYVPEAAHVRVHQIWMGDRADDAKAASYSAQDLMIVERDIGRLAKYTFDMGGAGDLLSLALSVPPWEDLHELDAGELKLTNLVTTDLVADVLPHVDISAPAWRSLHRRPRRGSVRNRSSLPSRPRRRKPWCRRAAWPRRLRRRRSSLESLISLPGPATSPDQPPDSLRTSALRRSRLLRLRLDLADGIDHGIEGQERRGVARLVVAHRLEELDLFPFAFRRRAVLLQHLANSLA